MSIPVSFWNASATPDSACPIRGTRLSATVATDSIRFPVSAPRSAFSSEIPVSRFCHAACMDEIDPWIVDAASAAVVPVMPILSCTTPIASMILSKETSFTVFAVTVIWLPSTPESLMSRAISDAVPPYPSFRLSSIV